MLFYPDDVPTVAFAIEKELICKKKVVGRKLIPEHRIPERVIPEHWEDVVEWECEPILKGIRYDK